MGVNLSLGCRLQLFSNQLTLFDKRILDFRVVDYNEPAPKKLIKYGGDNQVYTNGQYLNLPVSVKVNGWFNTPMPWAYVHFIMKSLLLFLCHLKNSIFIALDAAKVILHPKAVERLRKGRNSFEGGCSGRPALFFCRILALLGKGEHRYPPIREEYLDRLITTDSEAFRTMNLPFQVLETPGHTADHISLLKDRILFCGDAAMNGFPSRKRITIWIENTEEYRRSWEKILETNPAVIYPAHGKAFRTGDLKKYLKSLDRVKLRPL